jgi:hypothetical protein
VVSIDPYDAYRQAIHAALPHARIVCDHFHLVRGANAALDAVRRERQREAKARRPKGVRRSGPHAAWRPELYRSRHRLLKARERLTSRERRRLSELFERDLLVAEAWWLKERFRDVYRASDPADAQRRLQAFLAAVDRAGLPAFDAFAKGTRIWQQELLAYFDEPTTNGSAEGVINQVIKRRAYAIPTFTAFRQRVLLSMRLIGTTGAAPLNRREATFRPAKPGQYSLEHLQAQAPGARAPDLDGDADLLPRWRPPLRPSFQAAEEEPVDLDLVLGRLALRGDHRPAQLGQDQPRRAVARRPELLLKLLGRDTRMVRGDEVSRREPCAQRRARRVQHGPGRQRGLLPQPLHCQTRRLRCISPASRPPHARQTDPSGQRDVTSTHGSPPRS